MRFKELSILCLIALRLHSHISTSWETFTLEETNSHSLLIKSNSLTAQTVTLSLLLCAAGFSGNINTVLRMIGL